MRSLYILQGMFFVLYSLWAGYNYVQVKHQLGVVNEELSSAKSMNERLMKESAGAHLYTACM